MATKTSKTTTSSKAQKLFDGMKDELKTAHAKWVTDGSYKHVNGKALAAKIAKAGGKVVSVNKKTFGFNFEMGGKTWQMFVTASKSGVRPVA